MVLCLHRPRLAAKIFDRPQDADLLRHVWRGRTRTLDERELAIPWDTVSMICEKKEMRI